MQDELHALALRIKRQARTHAAHVVVLGRLLLQAKALCAVGGFQAWFRSLGADFSLRTAQEAMTAATRFLNVPNLHRLTPTTLRMLGSLNRSKREIAIDQVLELSEQGKVSWAEVRSIITATDPTSIYGYPEGHPLHDNGENTLEAIGRRLVTMLSDPTVSSLHFSPDHDTGRDSPHEKGGGESVQLTVLGEEEGKAKRLVVTRRELGATLAAAVGEEKKRLCKKCGRELDPSAFSKACRNCKRCERARVKSYETKKKAKKKIDPEAN